MSTLEANLKQKRVKTTQEREKVHCYWTIRLAGRFTRRGEKTLLSATLQFAVASKHCSLSRCNSPWRARLLVVASHDSLLSGMTIFHSKNPIFIQPNPKFDRELNLWWFYNQFLPHDLIPKFAKQQQQQHAKFNFRIT